MDAREQRGLEIAAKAKLQRQGNRWFVPSQSGKTGISQGSSYYTVKPDISNPECNCPDHEMRGLKCKHIYAVEYTIKRSMPGTPQVSTPFFAGGWG